MNPLTMIVFVFILIPCAAIVVSWYRFWQTPDLSISKARNSIPLILVTLSWMFFLAGSLSQKVFGPYYSTQRYVLIYVNLSITLLMMIVILRGSHRYKDLLAASAGAVSVAWLYLAVVNAAI